MNIQNKLLIVFIAFGGLLIVSLVGVVQWSINKGMVEYVNQKEINVLSPFMEDLVEHYQLKGNWQYYRSSNRVFERSLRESLKGTDFSLPPRPNHPPEHQLTEGEEQFNEHHRNFFNDKRERIDRKKFNDEDRKLRPKKPAFRRNAGPNFDSPDNAEVRSRLPEKKVPKVSYALLDKDQNYVVGNYPTHKEYSLTPLILENRVVGYMAISKRTQLAFGYEFDFVEQQDNLWVIALVILCGVLAITLPFARHLLSPIKALAIGMNQLTKGSYSTHLSTNRTDEFSDLTRDFNELAKTLLENETARKRWLANISHELRTPVAILKGELEAILDGVRELSIEQIQSAHQEVIHLQRLIADLQALTSADIGGMSYRKKSINIITFIEHELSKLRSYLAASNLNLLVLLPESINEVSIFADKTRLCQLFENIMNNSIKYAKDGTTVRLTLSVDNAFQRINIIIEDDGAGVDDEHLPLLFEHLYRVDNSRNRNTGGSGLGLSICAHIVHAHHGNIMAEKSVLGGLAIHISLPLQS